MSGPDSRPEQDARALAVAHVADFYRRYPGEPVTFYTRVEVLQDLPDLTVRVSLPEGLALTGYERIDSLANELPEIELVSGIRRLVWKVEREVPAGSRFECRVEALIGATERDTTLESRALAFATGPGGARLSAEETAAVLVSAKGDFLRYLPGLYSQDELMGRLLMLFESFWGPIGKQIDNLPYYFDPALTTTQFLPWLASWLDLTLDERLPEERRRRLVQSAVSLYRKRGTRPGLQEYLELYTGGQVEIVEHRARNFRLGAGARLGRGIALGTANRPHTFTVTVRLPALSGGEGERARLESERRWMIESLIEREKPAHTAYTLVIETATEDEQREGTGS